MGRHSKVLLWKRKFAALPSLIVMLTFCCSSSSLCTLLHSSSSVHVVVQLLERPTTISPRQKYLVGDSELGMLMCTQTPKAFLSCLITPRPRPNMVEVEKKKKVNHDVHSFPLACSRPLSYQVTLQKYSMLFCPLPCSSHPSISFSSFTGSPLQRSIQAHTKVQHTSYLHLKVAMTNKPLAEETS